MKRLFVTVVAGLVVAISLAAMVAADPAEEANKVRLGKKYALIIGISEYKEFERLPKASEDARAISKTATQKRYDHVTVLVNEQATRERIRAAMTRIRAELKENDLFALFFAGHGQRKRVGDDGEFAGYLIPHECRRDKVQE